MPRLKRQRLARAIDPANGYVAGSITMALDHGGMNGQ
jgi:ribosome modulation factor